MTQNTGWKKIIGTLLKGEPQKSAEQSGARFPVSRVYFINLEDLIVQKYATPEPLFKRADRAAKDVIHDNLEKGEFLRSDKPGSYYLFFPTLRRDAGELKCSVIADKIARAIKEIAPPLVELKYETATVMAPRRQLGEFTHGPGEAEKITAPSPLMSVAERIRQKQMRDLANAALQAMTRETSPDLSHVPLTDDERSVIDGLALEYRPVWFPKNNLITAYYAAPAVPGEQGDLQSAPVRKMLQDASDDVRARYDVCVYQKSREALTYLMDNDIKAIVIVPVHFSTLASSRTCVPFLAVGSDLHNNERDYLVFEVRSLPQDMTKYRLREIADRIRAKSRAMMARPGLGSSDLAMYKDLGFHAVGATTAEHPMAEDALIAAFDTFVEAAEKAKLHSFVHSLSTSSLTIAAMAAGFTYLDGPAIATPVTNPAGIQPYDVGTLMTPS